jgi:L-threonylcarbamoyladenylate synthase
MSLMLNKLSDTQIGKLLQGGAVGVIPTDTIYGLAALAADEKAVGRLYALKQREQKPGTVIAANIDQLIGLGIKARYLKAVEHFWPNPISIIIPVGSDLTYLHQGKFGLACRVIKFPSELLNMLSIIGPLLTTSANLPGEAPSNTVEQAQKYFGINVDFYVDGGDLSGHKPSTVIRVVDDAVEVLRPGAVRIDEATGRIVP